MTDKESSFNTYFFISLGIIFVILVALLGGNTSHESNLENLSSYYLPIFSFGKIDFPPLEF